MFTWLRQIRERLAQRRAERRATAGDRALRRQEAKAQRLRHERMDDKGPLGPGI